MLIQYAVSNYKSIKDEVVINFAKVDDKPDDSWTISIEKPQYELYNIVGLIGPNASGKSNIIDSFYFAIRFIKKTISRKEKSKIAVEPFRLENNEQDQLTSFEYIYPPRYKVRIWFFNKFPSSRRRIFIGILYSKTNNGF